MNDETHETADSKVEEPDAGEAAVQVTADAEPDAGAQVPLGDEEPSADGGRSGWLVAYLAAFVLVVAATAVMAFGGLSLLRTGSTIQGSTTLFWVSIVLAVVSIVLAGAAVVLSRKR